MAALELPPVSAPTQAPVSNSRELTGSQAGLGWDYFLGLIPTSKERSGKSGKETFAHDFQEKVRQEHVSREKFLEGGQHVAMRISKSHITRLGGWGPRSVCVRDILFA